jgi:hypothetical protein
VDLLADLTVPSIAAAEFGLVEPDLDASCPKCVSDTLRSRRIFGRITQEDGIRWRRHRDAL